MPSTRDSESAWEDTSIAAPPTPAWTMRAEEGLELERLGRGLARGLRVGAHPVLDRADHAGRSAARAEQGLDQQRRRGLAVGAGDADHGEAPGRVTVIDVGEPRQGLARGRHQDPRRRAARQWIGALGHHHGGTAAERVRREAPAVLLEAGDRHEERARRDLSRVVRETGHLGGQRAQHRLVRQGVEERGGRHGVVAHVLSAGGSPRGRRSAARPRGPAAAGRPFRGAAARRAAGTGSSPPRGR